MVAKFLDLKKSWSCKYGEIWCMIVTGMFPDSNYARLATQATGKTCSVDLRVVFDRDVAASNLDVVHRKQNTGSVTQKASLTQNPRKPHTPRPFFSLRFHARSKRAFFHMANISPEPLLVQIIKQCLIINENRGFNFNPKIMHIYF